MKQSRDFVVVKNHAAYLLGPVRLPGGLDDYLEISRELLNNGRQITASELSDRLTAKTSWQGWLPGNLPLVTAAVVALFRHALDDSVLELRRMLADDFKNSMMLTSTFIHYSPSKVMAVHYSASDRVSLPVNIPRGAEITDAACKSLFQSGNILLVRAAYRWLSKEGLGFEWPELIGSRHPVKMGLRDGCFQIDLKAGIPEGYVARGIRTAGYLLSA